MFPGSPAPLPPAATVRTLQQVLPPRCTAGAWLRGASTLRLIHLCGGRRMLVSRDLGTLLRRCDVIVVTHGGRPDLLSAGQLVRCRVLQIVLGTPFLPPPSQLRRLYPALTAEGAALTLPIGLGSAEEALAICSAEGLSVRATRVGYAPVSG